MDRKQKKVCHPEDEDVKMRLEELRKEVEANIKQDTTRRRQRLIPLRRQQTQRTRIGQCQKQ